MGDTGMESGCAEKTAPALKTLRFGCNYATQCSAPLGLSPAPSHPASDPVARQKRIPATRCRMAALLGSFVNAEDCKLLEQREFQTGGNYATQPQLEFICECSTSGTLRLMAIIRKST